MFSELVFNDCVVFFIISLPSGQKILLISYFFGNKNTLRIYLRC